MYFEDREAEGICDHPQSDPQAGLTARGGQGIGTRLVDHARRGAQAVGCEYLHVDFEDHLAAFYYDACGFRPASAGLLELN